MAKTRKDLEPKFDPKAFEDPSANPLIKQFTGGATYNPNLNVGAAPKPVSSATSSGEPNQVIRNERGGLTDKQVRDMAAVYNQQQSIPAGYVDAAQAAEQRARVQEGGNLAGQVGNVDPNLINSIESKPLNLGSVFGAGAAGAVAGAGAGLITAGTLSIPLAVIGFITGAVASMRSQLAGEISAAGTTQSKVETNLKALITDTNSNPQNAATNLELFNYQLSLLDQQHAKLKLETQRDLNKYLSKDGKKELYKFELFNTRGGPREFLINKMQVALVNPNPNSIDVTLEELQGVQNE